MKIKNKIIASLTLLLGMFSVTSCINDLNVTPIDPSTKQTFNQDSVFAKIYADLALTGQKGPAGSADISNIDEGTSSFIRLIWNLNELTTDEAICSWGDPGIPEMDFNKWTSSHDQIEGIYDRLMFGVTLCNFFLTETDGKTDDISVKQRAEVRFLRALNYYYLMDMFGNPPFTEVVSSGKPPQIQRADLYAWLIIEIKTAETDMYDAKQAPYYRADKVAADMLLARLYLNAEVYTGTADWNNAAIYAKKVIDSGYTLASEYKYLFMADNAGAIDGSTVNDAPNEIIFPIASDGKMTTSYANSTFLILSTHTSGMPNWGSSDGWGGNRARAKLSSLFFPTGVVFSDLTDQTATTLTTKAADDRAMFWGWEKKDSKGIDPLTISAYTTFKQGLAVTKWKNIRADEGTTHDSYYTDTDVPLLRLAEAYLTYAEAVYRGAPADGMTAIDAVNALRNRAHATTLLASQLSLSSLCDEWAREFYFEGRRRIDLIRFGNYGGNSDYTWDWKGGSAVGSTFSSNYNVFPIPAADISANSNLIQNTGY